MIKLHLKKEDQLVPILINPKKIIYIVPSEDKTYVRTSGGNWHYVVEKVEEIEDIINGR